MALLTHHSLCCLEEFSALMRTLSTLAVGHCLIGNSVVPEGSSSIAHDLHQRASAFRLQGMDFENQNLARNTKEAYLTYLKFFQVRVLE